MRRMPFSAETAVKLAEYMKVPLEHLMHMPQHILLQKLAEMAKSQSSEEKQE
ncbi:YycC family protein [Cohnella terricola]|uniref:YycC family protein n=1 Tax=Cohnella terricola TaxID=1289167 RepID=A0A559JL54_9BACL|nr:YycC family protein [Cohnella terricola]TVY00617.1 YycC family protein [Cohnella terricola]